MSTRRSWACGRWRHVHRRRLVFGLDSGSDRQEQEGQREEGSLAAGQTPPPPSQAATANSVCILAYSGLVISASGQAHGQPNRPWTEQDISNLYQAAADPVNRRPPAHPGTKQCYRHWSASCGQWGAPRGPGAAKARFIRKEGTMTLSPQRNMQLGQPGSLDMYCWKSCCMCRLVCSCR